MEWFYRSGSKFSAFSNGGVFARLESENPEKGTATTYHVDNCTRCGGAGGSEAWKFTGWTCYRCGGLGREAGRTTKLYSAEKLEKLDKALATRRANKAAKDAAEREVNTAKFKAENGYFAELVAEVLEGYGDDKYSSPLFDMTDRANNTGELSDKAFNYATLLLGWRFEELDREAGRNVKAAASNYVGEVGTRLKGYTAKVVFFKRLEDRYFGYTPTSNYMVKFEDAEGNFLVYFGSAPPSRDPLEEEGYGRLVEAGDTVTFNAGVSKHDEYKGAKTTTLKRPHWSSVENAPEEVEA